MDEEGLKEKKKQRLMKAGYEARIRAKREKERDREEKEAEDRKEEEEREQDLGEWSGRLRREQEVCHPFIFHSWWTLSDIVAGVDEQDQGSSEKEGSIG